MDFFEYYTIIANRTKIVLAFHCFISICSYSFAGFLCKKEEQTEICSSWGFTLFCKGFYCIKVLSEVSLEKSLKCLPCLAASRNFACALM